MRKVQVVAALLLLAGVAAAAVLLTSAPEEVVKESTGSAPMTSADCAGCHSEIAKEVAASWHGQAYTDPEALALTRNFQDQSCISCHAPAPVFQTGIGERVFARRERRVDGVDCVSCHLLPDGRVAGTRGLTHADCRPVVEPRLSTASFCAGCHNQHWTVDEWAASPYFGKKTCNECHMARVDRPLADGGPVRNGVRTHLFEGGHFVETLKEAASLEAEVKDGELIVRVTNSGAGHNIPTDSRHKSYNVVVTVRDEDGNLLADQEEIAEYRLYYRTDNLESTQIPALATRVERYPLPDDRKGTVVVELVYCLKPPQKETREWTPVHRVERGF
ncbi:MAG: multiheme c-type cytochrome [Planctomycetota bacterium]|jgi:hypothetical protein